MAVPDPPDLAEREPLVETWRAGAPLHRVHPASYRPDAFNPSDSVSRFRPFRSGSRYVPTLYAADSLRASFAESIFHDLEPAEEQQIVPRSALYGTVRSVITPRRDLELISLRGAGLRRLRTTAGSLVHSSAEEYPATAAYAAALYRWKGRADGLVWDARLHPGSRAIMLFGTRVRSSTLSFSYETVEPLWKGIGLDDVLLAAEEAGIVVVM